MEGLDTFDFSAPPKPKQEGLDTSGFDSFDFSAPMTQKAPQEEDGPGFVERTAPQLAERNQRIASDFSKMISLEVSPQEAMFNAAGEMAGSFLDVVGEGITSAVSMTPDFIKEPVAEGAAHAFKAIATSDVGRAGLQAMESGIGAYRDWKSGNPREARMLENFVNIGVVIAPAKVKANAEPSMLTKASNRAKNAAETKIAGDRGKFVQELVGPTRGVVQLKKEVPRTTEKGAGPFKRSVVEPSPREKEIAAEVSKIAGVTPKNTIQGNFNAIQAENKRLAIKLENDVKKADIKIPQQNVLQEIDDVIDEAISNNMYIVGSGENAAEKLRSNVGKIILKHEDKRGFIKGESLLAARKALDREIRKQKPSVFKEGTAESAIEIMSKATRNAMNDILDRNVTGSRKIDVAVKQELKKQSLLFGAMDNIVPKAAAEGNNAIIRALQNAMKATHLKNEVVQLLALSAGIGGLGAAAFAAPIVRDASVIAGLIYGAYKTGSSAQLKQLTSKTLGIIDSAIKVSTNQEMKVALRSDRAIIVEMIKNIPGHLEANKPIPSEQEQ